MQDFPRLYADYGMSEVTYMFSQTYGSLFDTHPSMLTATVCLESSGDTGLRLPELPRSALILSSQKRRQGRLAQAKERARARVCLLGRDGRLPVSLPPSLPPPPPSL